MLWYLGLGCYFLTRGFRAGQQVEENDISQPPTMMVVNLQSAGVVLSAFLTEIEHFKAQLQYLEQCMEKAINCDDSGSIQEIEEQLRKLQVNNYGSYTHSCK